MGGPQELGTIARPGQAFKRSKAAIAAAEARAAAQASPQHKASSRGKDDYYAAAAAPAEVLDAPKSAAENGPQKMSIDLDAAPVANFAPIIAQSTKIFVQGLMVEAECGVYSHEKGAKRPLVVDVAILVDNQQISVRHDELSETIDYDKLVAIVRKIAGGQHLHLIETFAEQVAQELLADPRIIEAQITVEKPGAIPGARCSGVEIIRRKAL